MSRIKKNSVGRVKQKWMVEMNSKFKNSKDRKTFIQLDYLIYRNLANFDVKVSLTSMSKLTKLFCTIFKLGVLAFITSILRSSMFEMSSLPFEIS